jgi:TRAP-type C4-dicarboxylate transport system substrate-binding protein
MAKRKVLYLVILVLIAFAMQATSTSAATQKPIELAFASSYPDGGWVSTHAIKPWIKQAMDVTKGMLKINLYSDQTLVKQTDQVSAVRDGVADISFINWTLNSELVQLNQIPCLPGFVWKSDVMSNVVMQQTFDHTPALQKELSFVKVLFQMGSTQFYLATTKKEVKSPEDIKGLKIRVAGSFSVPYLKALGAVPVSMSSGELYLSLQQGIVDGALINSEMIGSFRLYEVCKYYTHFPNGVGPVGMAMNLNKWNSLPADVQQQLMSISGIPGTTFFAKNFYTSLNDAKQIVEKAGYKLNIYYPKADEAVKWAAPADTIRDQYIKDMQAKGHPDAPAIFEKVKKLRAEYKGE